MKAPSATNAAGSAASPRWYEHSVLHLGLLAVLTACYVAVSWRRWPDPLVDFGRELYLPWRLADGAVLYRDVEDFYGPLSQYLNAALFRCFGPGMMVLVWANLVVFAGIITTTYLLVRRAWSPGAAFAGCAVFIAIFGFSRFVYVGNFNYATPYAHETTHGLGVLLLLAAVLIGWLRQPTMARNAAIGLLAGLTLVLKAEIALAAVVLVAVAATLRTLRGSRWAAREWLTAAGLALLPTLGFVIYFSRHLGFAEAWGAACRGWLNVLVTTRYIADPAQFKYAGLDAPWLHLWEHVTVTGGVILGLGAMVGAVRLFERRFAVPGARPAAIALAIALVWGACLWPDSRWIQSGQCLLGLLLVYLADCGLRWLRAHRAGEAVAPAADGRILLAVLGAVLMARMVLAGRIYQFGYYQAALATVVVVAVLVGEFPGRVAATRAGRRYTLAWVIPVLVSGVLVLTAKSIGTYQQIGLPMGRDRDRFHTFKASAPVVELAAYFAQVPPGRTLLVLPEGLMLNYLARMPSPAPHFFYYSAVTENGREARLVERLAARPPDFIVTLPRNLEEYGIAKYGVRSGSGGDILAWMQGRYQLQAWVRGDYSGPAPAAESVAYSNQYSQVFALKPPAAAPGPLPGR